MPVAATAALVHDLPREAPSFERGLRRALDAVEALAPLPVRSAALATSHDRVLAERVRAQADLPPRDVAAVDGYALPSAACRGSGPWRLRVTARLAASRSSEGGFPTREAVKIAAGSPVPPAFDVVLPLDALRREGQHILCDIRPAPGDGIAPRATEARCGDALAQPDRLLDTRAIAVLAAAGCDAVKVRRTLRVALLSTGGARRGGPGEAGRTMLAAALDRRWTVCRDRGAAAAGAAASALREAAAEADALVAIDRGGLRDALVDAGGRVVLDELAMTPGGGAGVGILGDAVVVMLPEEPVAALTAMAVLGWPVLRRRAGIQHGRAVPRAGVAAFSVPADPARAAFPLVRVAGAGEMPTLEAVADRAEEGGLARLARADGIAVLSPGQGVRFGGRIAWMPLCDRYA